MSLHLECRKGPLDGDERVCERAMLVVGFAPNHVAISVDHPSQVAMANPAGCYMKESDHLRWVPFP